MSAREIWEALPRPTSASEVLERARRIVREEGDLPEPVFYEMIMAYGIALGPQLLALRPPGAAPYRSGRI